MGANEISILSLSTILGISQKSMSNKLSGRTEFKRSEMIKLCNHLNVSMEYLFSEDQ